MGGRLEEDVDNQPPSHEEGDQRGDGEDWVLAQSVSGLRPALVWVFARARWRRRVVFIHKILACR